MSKITVTLEYIGPEKARQYLGMSAGNRNLREHKIRKYLDQITKGLWVTTHQGIAFDEDEILVDGHHRLHAIARSGAIVAVMVARNVPANALPQIDHIDPRTTYDTFKMSRMNTYPQIAIHVARIFPFVPTTVNPKPVQNDLEVHNTLEIYREGILFACDHLSKKSTGLSRAARCLVARAYYHVSNQGRLAEWCKSLTEGIITNNDTDSAAITYRNYLMRTSAQTGHTLELERYRKGQTALLGFMHRKPLTKLYGTYDDYYPLIPANELTIRNSIGEQQIIMYA